MPRAHMPNPKVTTFKSGRIHTGTIQHTTTWRWASSAKIQSESLIELLVYHFLPRDMMKFVFE